MKTKKYTRLPPEPGIPFIGFEFAEIESRKPVAKSIQNFIDYCIKDARSPAARIILGEWGEGKSEAYIRYIVRAVKEMGGFTYDVSAPSIIETYKTPTKNAKIKTTSATSVQFLITVFWAILDELRAKGIVDHKIPSVYDFADPIDWLQEILNNHAESGQLKLFIFIDQMEELILEPDVLKWFLTGIRETLDGKFFPISERGPYPGSLFFFLSCTPDAYNRMRVDPHIDQIFGGQQRRIDSIVLNPIGKTEGTKFFHDLLRYSYVDDLPRPLPFMSAGVLSSLYTATRGNLGAMVSLFTRLMSGIPSSDGQIDVVDGQFITDWLSNENISIYGGTTRCIEKELINAVESALQRSVSPHLCIKLFKTLVGELGPFSAQEIAEKFSLSISEVHRHINIINQSLESIASNSIIRLYSLKEQLTFNDIIEKLRALQWIDIDDSGEQIIHVDNYTEKLKELQDKLTFAEFDETNNLVMRVFLPYDLEAIQSLFEGISEENALKIRKSFERLLEQEARYFVISEAMVNRLYPIPVSPWLQFIKNRDLRLKLWRNVRANFHSYFQNEMSDSFVDLLGYTSSIQIPNRRDCPIKRMRYVDVYETNGKVLIRTVIFSKPYVSINEIQESAKDIRKLAPRPNLLLVLHSEDLPEDVTQQARQIDERILLIKMHPTYAKNLLAIYIALRDYYEHIDRSQVSNVLKNLAVQMEIDRRILTWIEEGRQKGTVLVDLTKDFANDDKELVDALKFYINFMGYKATPEEIYDFNNNNLLNFVPFGLRLGFAADIETKEQLKKITQDLKTNGFVIETREGKVEVVYHPVEKRILSILEERREVNLKFLEEFFVLSAAARKILPNVYLNILEHKGIIESIDDRIFVRNIKEYQSEVERKYKNYRNVIDVLLPIWKDYAHVYVTKQRAPRLILLKNLDQSICNINNSLQLATEDKARLQIMFLLEALINHFDENLRPKMEGAVQKSKDIVASIKGRFGEFERKLSDVLLGYNTLMKTTFDLKDVREYLTVEKGKNEINEFYPTELDEEDLLEKAELLNKELFDFHNYRRDDQFFNIKLSTLESMVKDFVDDVSRKLMQLDIMSSILANIRGREVDLESKIVTFKLGEECLITSKLFSSLQQLFALKKEVTAEKQTMQTQFAIKFSEMEKDLRSIESRFAERESSLGSAVEAIKELHAVETDCISRNKEMGAQLSVFISNLDIERYTDVLLELRESLQSAQKEYAALCESVDQYEIEARSLRRLRKKLEDIIDGIDDVQKRMEKIWEGYKNELKERVKTTFDVFMVLKERGHEVDESKLNSLIARADDLVGTAEKISPWLGKFKASDIENEFLKIRVETSDLLKKYLTSEETLVLQCIIDEKKRSGKNWVTLGELVESIKERGVKVDINEIIRRLIDKKILTQGVSLATGE